jgi:hypothetical protein
VAAHIAVIRGRRARLVRLAHDLRCLWRCSAAPLMTKGRTRRPPRYHPPNARPPLSAFHSGEGSDGFGNHCRDYSGDSRHHHRR